MKQNQTNPFQYERDQDRFIELIKKYTGIPKQTLKDYLKEHKIQDMYEHPDSLDVSEDRKQKLQEIAEIRRLYQNLRDNDKEYKLNNPMSVSNYFSNYYSEKRDREYVAVAFLNNQLNVIKTETLSEGTVDSAMISPREIAKKALVYDSKAVVMAHNHPGGSANPSMADISMTQRVQGALELFDIQLVDHLIIAGEGNTSSIRQLGHISEQTAPYTPNIYEAPNNFIVQPADENSAISYEKQLKETLNEIGHTVSINNKEELLEAQSLLSDSYVNMIYDEEKGYDKIEDIELKNRTLLMQHLESGGSSLFANGINEAVVSPSAKKEGMYQITYFDRHGATMDSLRSTKEECVRELQSNNLVPLRKEFGEFVREISQNESVAKALNFLTKENGINKFHDLENQPLKIEKIEEVQSKKYYTTYNIQLIDKEKNGFNYSITSSKSKNDLRNDWGKEMTAKDWLQEDIKAAAIQKNPTIKIKNDVPELTEKAQSFADFFKREKSITQKM